MINDGFTDTLTRLGEALRDPTSGLGPGGVPVHMPPFDRNVIGLPAIIVQLPTLQTYQGTLGGCHKWDFTAEILVVAGNTVGQDLPGIADAVLSQLTDNGVRVTGSSDSVYQPPDTPAGIPAVELTVE